MPPSIFLLRLFRCDCLGDATIQGELAQILDQRGGGMAGKGAQSPTWHKGEIEMLHLKETNGIDAMESLHECWTTHACWTSPQAVERGLAFSWRDHEQRFKQRALW